MDEGLWHSPEPSLTIRCRCQALHEIQTGQQICMQSCGSVQVYRFGTKEEQLDQGRLQQLLHRRAPVLE